MRNSAQSRTREKCVRLPMHRINIGCESIVRSDAQAACLPAPAPDEDRQSSPNSILSAGRPVNAPQ